MLYQAPFSDGMVSKYKEKEFYKMSHSVRTDSVDQDQTAQTVQSDVGFTLSVNLIFVKTIALKWQYSDFNNIFNFLSAGYGLN